MQRILLSIILLFGAATTMAQRGEKAISPRQMVKDILTLEADSMQGREPCTIGETRAVAYLTTRMKELGLRPAFGTSYTQAVPLVSIRSQLPQTITISSPEGIPLEYQAGTDISVWSPTTQPNISLKNSPMVFVGFGVNAPESQWDDFKGIDVKGKTIVVLVNDPGFYNHDTSLFKGKAMTYYGRWRYKFEEAERRGAAACLIVHDDAGAGYPWSVVNGHTNNKEFYIDDPALENPCCMVTGWLTKSAAVSLMEAAGYRLTDLMDAATRTIEDIRKALNEGILEDFKATMSEVRKIATKLGEGEGTLGKLINDGAVYADVQRIAANLAGVSDQLAKGEGTLGKLMNDGQLYADAQAVAANLKDISDRLNKGEGTLGKLLSEDDRAYEDLAATISSFRKMSESVEKGEGTLGKLVSDEALYLEFQALLREGRAALDDMRETSPVTTFTSIFFGAF